MMQVCHNSRIAYVAHFCNPNNRCMPSLMGLGLRRGIARTVCAVEHTGQIRELEQADRNARYIGNCWQGRQGCCYLNGFLQAFMLQLEKASTISLHYVQKCCGRDEEQCQPITTA
jgi:hypothetical protein